MLPRYEGGMTFSGVPERPPNRLKMTTRAARLGGRPPDRVPRMKWLAECSPVALGEALRAVARS
jgi:hypothetical protein